MKIYVKRWLVLPLAAVCSQQGRLYGRLDDLGMAQRDINELLGLGLLQKLEGGGRSAGYGWIS